MDLDKKLIKEIKNHKALYDSSHSMHKDFDYKQKVWVEIGSKLIGSEDETTSVAALKVRWKSLRDAYVKERKYDMARSCGMKVKIKKPWRLKKQMEFLAPFIHNRKDLSFDSSKENDENNFNPSSEGSPSSLESTDDAGKTPVNVQKNSSQIVVPRKNLFNQPVPESNTHRLIEIDSFFRNISDAVKTLNKRNQVLVQRDVTNLVMNYKLRELEEDGGNSL